MNGSEAGGTILSFTSMSEAMRFQAIGEVRAYWEALRGGRLVPERSDVDPRGIERVLSHAFILERVAPLVSRFRLAGSHLNDLLGMEVRGMPFTSFFTPASRTRMTEETEAVFQGPHVAEIVLAGETSIGKPVLDARLLLLPLRSDLGDVTRALGCLVSEGTIGRAPRRFDVVRTTRLRIVAGLPTGDATPAPAALGSPSPVGLAEAPAPFAGRPVAAPARGRPHLRLVKPDD
jgi:hypothetical protein